MRPSRRLLGLLLLGCVPAAFAGVSALAAALTLTFDVALLVLFLLDRRLSRREPSALVRQTLPERVARGRSFLVRWHVGAGSRRRRRIAVWSRLPPALEPRERHLLLEVGEDARHVEREGSLVALQRGRHTLAPPVAEQPTPLGLGIVAVPAEGSGAIDVLPDTRLLRKFDTLVRQSRLHEMGVAKFRERGEGTEIAGLRPYALGDRHARVDWKATARRGVLTTREMHTERRQNVLLLVDCGRRMAGESDGHSRLDHAIEAALLLAHVALRSDDRVGLVAFADRLLRVVQPVRGQISAAALAHALYTLTPVLREPPYTSIAAQVSGLFRRRSLLVLFTDAAEPASLVALVKPLRFLSQRHLVLCVVFRDSAVDRALGGAPADVPALYRAGAAAELAAERGQAIRQLEQAGALVLQTAAGQLSSRVVNRYLEIKARHLL